MSRIKRSGPPKRNVGLQTRTGLPGGGLLARFQGLRPVSKKRAAKNRERKKVVAEVFPERPMCVRPDCPRFADDVHEPLTRARGGSIVDPDNMLPLCRGCHDDIQLGPKWAYDLGLMKHSWPGDAA